MAENPRNTPDHFWLLLVVANFALLLVYLLFVVAVALYANPAHAWEWQLPITLDDNRLEHPADAAKIIPEYKPTPLADDRPKPPNVTPFEFPTYDGSKGDFKAQAPELAPFPDVNTEEVFKVVVNCFPERVPWGLEVKAVAGARLTEQDKVSTFDTAGLSRYYAGVVAEIPLFSASEINTERRTEYQRRTQLSENIAAFIKGLAAMRRAWREIGLYTGATLRAQVRIREGIAETSEQVGYVEKVAEAYSKLDDAKAAVDGARLALYGQCRNEVADEVNSYLIAVVTDFVNRPKKVSEGKVTP